MTDTEGQIFATKGMSKQAQNMSTKEMYVKEGLRLFSPAFTFVEWQHLWNVDADLKCGNWNTRELDIIAVEKLILNSVYYLSPFCP